MSRPSVSRRAFVMLYLTGLGLVSVLVWELGYARALGQVAERARSDLALASDRLVTQLQSYRLPAVLTAAHPGMQRLAQGGPPDEAEGLLLDLVDRSGAAAAFYADPSGRVLAAAQTSGILEGAGRVAGPAVLRALQGALGSTLRIDAEAGQRVFRYVAPSFGAEGRVIGVLGLEVDLDTLEQDWRGEQSTVFFRDASGVIFLSNRSELWFWRLDEQGLQSRSGEVEPLSSRVRHRHEIWRQNLSPYVPARALHQQRLLPVVGLTADALVDVGPARRSASLLAAAVAGAGLFFGSLLFLATERRRVLAAANRALEDRVRARTQELERANERLVQAQEDLVQAGKLSALGQMSAGISHELNQPLMAIRQFAENGAAFLARGDQCTASSNLERIADLAARAARIIKNLRAFARNEHEPMGRVDVVKVIGQAVELTETRLRAEAVALDWVPPGPVFVKGGEVRLTQVFVNLLNNAMDAMAGQATKRIAVEVHQGDVLRVILRDFGPGIVDPDRIFEPFYSTKSVGEAEGMGLGLSISYGLVQSFGGNIRGNNAPGGGAEFTVELDYWQDEAAA